MQNDSHGILLLTGCKNDSWFFEGFYKTILMLSVCESHVNSYKIIMIITGKYITLTNYAYLFRQDVGVCYVYDMMVTACT